ncbi:TMV resistance N-like, putative [Babesia ovis]|uniref:TMV resistance N-like, putative n=1 Tax=Babesia ovis TaxID=5869 RepID=A0A9W5TCV1_BABOV|nr:TMV resistance N-like, putative [Babesia ovis]
MSSHNSQPQRLLGKDSTTSRRFNSTTTTEYAGKYHAYGNGRRLDGARESYADDQDASDESHESDLNITNAKTKSKKLKNVVRYDSFKKWAKSYHGSVRNSISEEIANLCYTKYRYGMALKALTGAVTNRRIKQAKRDSDSFALKVILRRWNAIAKNSVTNRYDNASVSIFYQTSLSTRALRAFKMSIEYRKNYKLYINRLVEIMEKIIVDNGLGPLRQYARQSNRLDDCEAKISRGRKTKAKDMAFNALYSLYRCRLASNQCETLCRYFVLRQGWEHIYSRYRNAVEKEASIQDAVLRDSASTAFTYWHSATKEKQATQYHNFMLKYKTFCALRRRVEDSHEVPSESPTSDISDSNVVLNRQYPGRIQAVLCHKRAIIRAAGRLTKCLQKVHKRMLLMALMENSVMVAEDMLKQKRVANISNCRILNLVFQAWGNYTKIRRKKNNMKLMADLNYRGFLLSSSYQFIRNAYVEKIELFNGALFQFKMEQKLRHQHFYFVAFVSAVHRSRSLQSKHGAIEDLRNSHSKRAVMQRFEDLLVKSLAQKLTCVSKIGHMDLVMTGSNGSTMVHALRNLIFHKDSNTKDVLNCFKDKVLLENILMVLTMPLRSECVVFLHFISGLKTRASELMDAWGMRFDDVVVRLCHLLTSEDMLDMHSKYAYQLYVMRLQGFPQLDLGNKSDNKINNSNEISTIIHHKADDVTLDSRVNSLDWSEQKVDDEWEGQSEVSSLEDVEAISGRNTDLHGIPEWAVSLLQRLSLMKLFGLSYMKLQRHIASNASTALDLLCSGLPLWRLIHGTIITKRQATAFKVWRKSTSEKVRHREKLSEAHDAIKGLFDVSIALACFTHWVDLSRSRSEQKAIDLNQRLDKFVSFLSTLVYRSVSIVFMRLHLKFIMATYSGIERWHYVRTLSKAVAVSCRDVDAFSEIGEFHWYAVTRKQFNNWRMHTQWHIEVTRQAQAFYRDLFLRKGWNAIEAVYTIRKDAHNQLERSVKDGLKQWRLNSVVDNWYKTTRCQQAVSSLKPPKHVIVRSCFRHWKSYVSNEIRLANRGNVIKQGYDTCIIKIVFSGMVLHVNKSRALQSVQMRVIYTTSKQYMDLTFTAWRQLSKRNSELLAVGYEIKQRNDTISKEHIFSAMYQFTMLKRANDHYAKDRLFRLMLISAFSAKLSRVIDNHWTRTQESTCREFFEIQRAMRNSEEYYRDIMSSKGGLYQALTALSTLKESRVTAGINALQDNVKHKTQFKAAQNLCSLGVIKRVFGCWRRCTLYRIRATLAYGHSAERSQLASDAGGLRVNQQVEVSSSWLKLLSEDAMGSYCLVLTCFKHWRNTTIVLPDVEAGSLIEDFTAYNRVMDGIYLLRIHAFSSLWRRTCKARLKMLVSSFEDKLKLLMFHQWRAIAQQNAASDYDESQWLT